MEGLTCQNPSYPFLCYTDTENYGLCVKDQHECNQKISRNNDMLPNDCMTEEQIKLGQQYAYEKSNLHTDCQNLTIVVDNKYYNATPVPKNFKVCSWNVWGLTKKITQEFANWSIPKRLNIICDNILENDIDIVCLQEVSNLVFETIQSRLGHKYDFYDDNIDIEKTLPRFKRSLENIFIVRKTIKPSLFQNYLLQGNLDFNNNINILEFPNLVIINGYFQAGSKFSPGQENVAIHYSRCRYEQLKALSVFIEKYDDRPIIIVGDFNLNLDGNRVDWPETKYLDYLKSIGFIDSYRSLFPDMIENPGFTEDTQVNFMRYNNKFIEKQFRFDGILVKCIEPIDCAILGMLPISGLTEEETAEVIENYVYKKTEQLSRARMTGDSVALWPSDHFGIMTELQFE